MNLKFWQWLIVLFVFVCVIRPEVFWSILLVLAVLVSDPGFFFH